MQSLQDFIKKLEQEGELIRVSEPVSTYLEMTEIQSRLVQKAGPAVLLENVIDKDGKIMYISETASVHLGLSQVIILKI